MTAYSMWDDWVVLLVLCFIVMPVGVVATSIDIDRKYVVKINGLCLFHFSTHFFFFCF